MFDIKNLCNDYFEAINKVIFEKIDDFHLINITIFEKSDWIIKNIIFAACDEDYDPTTDLNYILEPLLKILLLYPLKIALHFQATQPIFIYEGIGKTLNPTIMQFWETLKQLNSPLFYGKSPPFQYFQAWYAKIKNDNYFFELHKLANHLSEDGVESEEILERLQEDRQYAEEHGLAFKYPHPKLFWSKQTLCMLGF